ncbi:MAG: preprotein translocase subunit SecE [Dehalococcoidia bacterium]
MSNRALRRQQTKEPKGKARSSGRTMPTTGPRTPGRKTSGGGILSWRPQFLVDVVSELRKVVWPEREDVVHLTVVIVIVTIIIGAVLGAIDIGFGWLIDRTLLN